MNKGIFIACIVIVIIAIIFNIWLGVTYGNKPADEVPFWVFWLMSD